MRLALVSDVHFGPKAWFGGKLRKLSHLAPELTREFVTLCNEIEHPDVVVNLGDVIEDESPEKDREAYGAFAEILGGAKARVLQVAGNHDLVNITQAELAAIWQRPLPLYYSLDLLGLHLVVLHTVHRRRTDVHLPAEQQEWLASDLAATSLPTLVFLHHPLSEMSLAGNPWFEEHPHICYVEERKAVRRVLEASRKVVGVFSGHVHWNHVDVISGIPYVTLQSLTENVDDDEPGLVEDDEPGRPARTSAIVDVDPKARSLRVRVLGETPLRYAFTW
jgi:3',5'-cyclic AMP phosphodiesterase CpdA